MKTNIYKVLVHFRVDGNAKDGYSVVKSLYRKDNVIAKTKEEAVEKLRKSGFLFEHVTVKIVERKNGYVDVTMEDGFPIFTLEPLSK